jgi:flagellin-like hook-associated protein FlgL
MDVAEESALLVAATTRQRFAASLLAQANLTPQIALRLLQQ